MTTAPAAADRSVLLIGGAGYIGPVVAEHLLARGYAVRVLDLFLYGNESVLAPFAADPRFRCVRGDHGDRAAMRRALAGASDVVVLSGLVGDPITKRYPEASRAINHDGMRRLIDALAGRGLGCVVFVSTCSNYGLVDGDRAADETHALQPLSHYAVAKVAMERHLLALDGRVDYRPTVLRFATAFGVAPRMRFDLTVSEFTREMFLERELLVYDADTWRPYCHVRDFAEVIGRVLEAPADDVAFQVFNAGGEINNFTKQMIVDAIQGFLPASPVRYRRHGADRRNYRVDFAKIRRVLGFVPRHTVADGIGELLAALRAGAFADVESRRNFYGNHEIRYPVAA